MPKGATPLPVCVALSNQSTRKAKEKAYEVNELSLDYHLSHAAFACNILLEDARATLCQEITKEIDAEIKKVRSKGDPEKKIPELFRRKSEKCETISKLRIYVSYLDTPELTAYTLLDKQAKQLVIWLPRKLLQKCRVGDSYKEEVVELRKLTAHELGHAILHTEKLINIEGLSGSRAFNKGSLEEHEAKVFAKNLLELRHKRNIKIRDEGTIDRYF